MKTTVKEQINAVNKARQKPAANRAGDNALNDAASTLAAVNLIGKDTILIAPELVQEVKELLVKWNAGQSVTPHIQNLAKIINRLPL